MTAPLHMPWTETNIARALAMQVFARRYLVMVPNCNWTGYECDLLAVAPDLRLVDIEVKISRADLKADAKKDKWWQREFQGHAAPVEKFDEQGHLISRTRARITKDTPREWPPKVWKHYYALPQEIWKRDLIDSLPSKSSGLILLRQHEGKVYANIERRSIPNRDAKAIDAEAAIDLARLASLRMWNTYQNLDDQRVKEIA